MELYEVELIVNDRAVSAKVKAETTLLDFLRENNLSFQGITGELRLVVDKERGRKSIVAMCNVANLSKFIDRLNRELCLDIALYPTHITLYTLGENQGIGIHSVAELGEKSSVVAVPKLLDAIKGLK